MKKIIIILISIVSIIYLQDIYNKQENTIPKEAIRFRVVANSNTIYDQNIKLRLKNVIQNEILDLTKDAKTIEATRKILKNNVNNLDKLVKKTLKDFNYDKDYTIKYGLNHFPKKIFKGVKYSEGDYESLVITLGDGQGDNWWCVLFPPFCLSEVEDTNNSDIEYSFFIEDIIKKYIKK